MHISRVEEGSGGGEAAGSAGDDLEYQTASELFDLMAKNHPFDYDAEQTLSPSDLVILYKNIELGTQLMNETDVTQRRPNQRVETIVCNDGQDSEESDSYDVISSEDIHNMFMANEERLDLLSNCSLENTLCPKLGDLEFHNSNISTQYDKYFLFKDPYIKEQLNTLNFDNSNDESFLPSSLLDYICCKRLEDNYNFDMDNIIRYVTNTIEQLKRISNGDYLTDRAKEKWREVGHSNRHSNENNTKVLAMSTSIPLQVERKINGHSSTWDDIIHSEVDVRSLSKILEKKIVVEIPKLICGSYKLFSTLRTDNLIISCKKKEEPELEAKKESRVDVVLQLERSNTGHVISNINSIMILQTAPAIEQDQCTSKVLPLTYAEEEKNNEEHKLKIIEINDIEEEEIKNDERIRENVGNIATGANVDETLEDVDSEYEDTYEDSKNDSITDSCDSVNILGDILGANTPEHISVPFNFPSPNDLSLAMQKHSLTCLPEERDEDGSQNMGKRKSPTKIRVKSPYENKSLILEEKKRRKLLEIRERREKRKIALGEHCKVSKNKYIKGTISPQQTNSVTKLSITNKSFYNSIYGNTVYSSDSNYSKIKGRKGRGNSELGLDTLKQLAGEDEGVVTPDKNSEKYVNRSYYLDDAVTEMMYTELKQSDCSSDVRELFSTSNSGGSNDSDNISVSHTADSLISNTKIEVQESCQNTVKSNQMLRFDITKKDLQKISSKENIVKLTSSRSNVIVVPENSPKDDAHNKEEIKKFTPVECRKSIDKVYDLIKKIGTSETEISISTTKLTNISVNRFATQIAQGSSTVQCSDSGTSMKHRLTSSIPSSFSFEKIDAPSDIPIEKSSPKKKGTTGNVMPKIVASSKQQNMKAENDKSKRDKKKAPPAKFADNPLKAISQLLHDIDIVQRNKQKSGHKKPDVFEGSSRPGSLKKRPKDPPQDEAQVERSVKFLTPKERRARQVSFENSKIPHPHATEDKHANRVARKNIADIIDEVKEAKGEAVRGPPKSSRLDSLAQPKRSYVQAHSEEYQTRYGRSMAADRLQRLAALPGRGRRPEPGRPPAAPLPTLDRGSRPVSGSRARRPGSSSPVGRPAPDAPSSKQYHVADAPDALQSKMVPVDSNVKSHHRRALGAARSPGPGGAPTARAPLVPKNVMDSSLSPVLGKESDVIGDKLRRLIDDLIKSKQADRVTLNDILESESKRSPEGVTDDLSLVENVSRDGVPSSSVDSDFRTDLFQDKSVRTAVEEFENQRGSSEIVEELAMTQDFCTSLELQTLENALSCQLLGGNFQKRLRIKNLTLTPKQSIQQTLLLQSGDDGSIVLKSMSNSLKISSSEDLKSIRSLTKPELDWKFTGIPLKITTVGYAFPKYKNCGAATRTIKSLHDVSKANDATNVLEKGEDQNHKDQIVIPSKATMQDVQVAAVFSDINNADLSSAKKAKKKKHIVPAAVATEQVCESLEQACGELIKSITFDKSVDISIDKSIDKCIDKPVDIEEVNAKHSNEIDYTSSLDILVGLLNEIQKITTGHMTTTCFEDQECKQIGNFVANNNVSDKMSRELEFDYCSNEIVSIISLENMRQLDSSPSLISLYISNDEKEIDYIKMPVMSTKSVICDERPICVDTGVGGEIIETERVNTFTDVPSYFFPVKISHSTHVTNSLLGIISEPSSHTFISLRNNQELSTKSIMIECRENIFEITRHSADDHDQISREPILEPSKIENALKSSEKANEQNKESKKTEKEIFKVKKYRDKGEFLSDKYCMPFTELDPLLNMKRDILVTMYSMLVFTVFAALSFPDIMNHFRM